MPSSGVQTCALRSEEHTSELQSHDNLVCRLLLENNNAGVARDVLGGVFRRANPSGALRSPGLIASAFCGHCGHLIGRKFTRVASLFFFFKDTGTTEIYPLSPPDALPI